MRRSSNEPSQGRAPSAASESKRINGTQQAVIARLAQHALGVSDIQSLLQTTTEWVAETLGVPLCAVLRPCQEEGNLLIVAGVGWRDGIVGLASVSATRTSQAGYALLADRPVVVNDLAQESGFDKASFVLEHGAVSGVNVGIRCVVRPLGVLAVHSTTPREFTQPDVDFLQAIANVLAIALRWRDDAAHAARVTAVMEASPDFVGMLSPDGCFHYKNPAFRDALGHGPQDDVAHWRLEDHHPSWAVDRIKTDGIPAAMQHGVWFGETAIRRVDGSESPVSELIVAHRGADGEVEHLSMVMRDVSDRKRLECEVTAKNRLLEAMANAHTCSLPGFDFSQLFDGIMADLLALSESAGGLIGEVVTQNDGTQTLDVRATMRVAPHDAAPADAMKQASGGLEFPYSQPMFERVCTARVPVFTNDAAGDFGGDNIAGPREAPQTLLGLPLLHAGHLVGVVVLTHRPQGYDETLVTYLEPFVDVCAQMVTATLEDRKGDRAPGAMRAVDNRRQRASRVTTTGELAFGMAHEMAQPLTSIVNDADAMLQKLGGSDLPDDDMRMLGTRIAEQAKRTAAIVKGMSRCALGKPPKRSKTDVSGVVREVVEFIQRDPRSQGVSIRVESDPDIPPIDVDPTQIEQVLVNLMVNALDAMASVPSGAPEIVVGIHRDGDSTLDVSVADSGPGLEASRLEQVFDPFVTTKDGGTGMGLAISRTIAEDHGGRLFVAHDRDGNTVFHLTLPLPEGEASVP